MAVGTLFSQSTQNAAPDRDNFRFSSEQQKRVEEILTAAKSCQVVKAFQEGNCQRHEVVTLESIQSKTGKNCFSLQYAYYPNNFVFGDMDFFEPKTTPINRIHTFTNCKFPTDINYFLVSLLGGEECSLPHSRQSEEVKKPKETFAEFIEILHAKCADVTASFIEKEKE